MSKLTPRGLERLKSRLVGARMSLLKARTRLASEQAQILQLEDLITELEKREGEHYEALL